MKTPRKSLGSASRLIIGLLLVSGLIRLGTVGTAIAREASAAETKTAHTSATCTPAENYGELLEVIKTRSNQLDDLEIALLTKETDLKASEEIIRENLDRLEAAERRLAATIDMVDGASENDLAQLTSVYEAMKPKVAAQLFSQMTPDFAAGFLARMVPNVAGAILSGLEPDHAYAISVVLAGRNANVPTE